MKKSKRLIDLVVSTICIFLGFPIFLIVYLIAFFKLGRPIFFRQKRPGLKGKPFEMIKFRTMKNAYDKAGNLLPDEKRLTRFGMFLRSTSLDELPELINVLKGEMSLVGPRPLLMEYLPLYNEEQMRRHDVLPGITGWAQINGRNCISWAKKFELDVWYVDNRSFWLDLKIIFFTIWKVVTKKDINQPGHATMKKFEGNEAD